jgi:hypothetical protein
MKDTDKKDDKVKEKEETKNVEESKDVEDTKDIDENKDDDIENQNKNKFDILFDNFYTNNINNTNDNNNANSNINNLTVKYSDVDDYFSENYTTNNNNNSNILDVIAIYIKGQKILYTEAKTTCEQRLTFLMLPSILFTILSSIINLLMDDINGKITTTILNGLITFILAVINYLKLDARSEAHRSSAYKYDKLLSYIEFQSCKQLFLDYEAIKMAEIFSKIENDVKDIKETNQFVLPESIRYNFPILSNINIFSEVKKIFNDETILMNKLSYVLNDIRRLEYDLYKNNSPDINKEEIRLRLEMYINAKKELTEKILQLQSIYISLDKKFKDEMHIYSKRNRYRLKLFEWLKV